MEIVSDLVKISSAGLSRVSHIQRRMRFRKLLIANLAEEGCDSLNVSFARNPFGRTYFMSQTGTGRPARGWQATPILARRAATHLQLEGRLSWLRLAFRHEILRANPRSLPVSPG